MESSIFQTLETEQWGAINVFNNLPACVMVQGRLLQGPQEPKKNQRSLLTVLSHTALHRTKSLQCVALSLDVLIFFVLCSGLYRKQERHRKIKPR